MRMIERIRRNRTTPREVIEFPVRLPQTALSDMDEVVLAFGFTDKHALIRAYISDGLRQHLSRLEEKYSRESTVQEFGRRLAAHGIPEQAIADVAEEMRATV